MLYRSNILQILFQYVKANYTVTKFPLDNIGDTNPKILRQIQKDEEFLSLFTFIISKRLIVIDDLEFQGKNKSEKYDKFPFIPFEEIRYVSWILNNIAYRIFWSNQSMSRFSAEFLENIKRAITGLYERDKRLKINGENFWIIEKDMYGKYEALSNQEITRAVPHSLLLHVPHTIPFQLRARIFQHIIYAQGEEAHGYHPISICRSYILENAYDKIFMNKINLKKKLQIQFINEHGQKEEGIDGGGLFKEFITKLCDKIFDPEYGYFKENERDRKLMPNFVSRQFNNYRKMFKFFGMIVGKAMFEGTLLKCTFTKTFLNRLAKKSN